MFTSGNMRLRQGLDIPPRTSLMYSKIDYTTCCVVNFGDRSTTLMTRPPFAHMASPISQDKKQSRGLKGQTAGPEERLDDLTGLRQKEITETPKNQSRSSIIDKSKPDPISSLVISKTGQGRKNHEKKRNKMEEEEESNQGEAKR